MSEDSVFDDKVRISHTIEYCEEISVAEYDLRTAAQLMSEEELQKVFKYINRLTKKRLPLYTNKAKPSAKKCNFSAKKCFTV